MLFSHCDIYMYTGSAYMTLNIHVCKKSVCAKLIKVLHFSCHCYICVLDVIVYIQAKYYSILSFFVTQTH